MIFKRELAEKVIAGEKTVTRRVCSENPRSPWWRERFGVDIHRNLLAPCVALIYLLFFSIMNIDTATPRQLVCGLMRGNALDLKLGYSAAAAVNTVGQIKQLTATELDDLRHFAEGFAIGINEDTSALQPVTVDEV